MHPFPSGFTVSSTLLHTDASKAKDPATFSYLPAVNRDDREIANRKAAGLEGNE